MPKLHKHTHENARLFAMMGCIRTGTEVLKMVRAGGTPKRLDELINLYEYVVLGACEELGVDANHPTFNQPWLEE